MELFRYLTPTGKDVLGEWLAELRDPKMRARVVAEVLGPPRTCPADNFGDCKPVGEGVWELRIDFGPGYRVYYAIAGKTAILPLCSAATNASAAGGGHFDNANRVLKDYQRRTSKQ